MGMVILLILIGLPLAELMVLIEVGGEIGGLGTILLCLATAALGLNFIRGQGLNLMERINTKARDGEAIGKDVAEGVGLALSGICLLIPGLITDGLGFLLLIPALRRWIVNMIASRTTVHGTMHAGYAPFKQGDNTIIEGEAVRVDDPGFDAENSGQPIIDVSPEPAEPSKQPTNRD